MDLPTQTVIDVLTFLLPGFVAAQLLYALTPAPRPIPFERVVQALIFTIFIQVCVGAVEASTLEIGSRGISFGAWTERTRLAWSLAVALLIALVLAWAETTDKIHKLLRGFGVTHQTSYSSEWFGAFSQNRGYIVLHLTGERRLYGWAEEWPSTPDRGHFVITQAEWLDDGRRIELAGVRRVLIRAQDVEMVELMHTAEDLNGRPQAADSSPSPKGD